MYRKKIVYIEFGTIAVSALHWESWNVSPEDKGGLLCFLVMVNPDDLN